MQVIGRVIKKHRVPNIAAHREEFRRMFEDMRQSAGAFLPAPTWLLCQRPENIKRNNLAQIIDAASSDEVFEKEFSDLEGRMDGWVGIHRHGIAEEVMARKVADFATLLQSDPLDLWRANVNDPSVAAHMKAADLGSIMDLNFLYAYSFDPGREVTHILEIGGGYGRLAEAALNVFGRSIRFVLVDSVPVSLYYAKEYMKRACPEIRVGSYYDGDPFDLNQFECYIVPSWYFEKLNQVKYDICINIDSFQEMNQEHLDTYLKLFDRVSVDGAMIYISNAHDYIFRGNWNYPAHWQKLLCANTPRAESPDHRTEVFFKGQRDFSARNSLVDNIHTWLVSKRQAAPLGTTVGDQIERLAGKRARRWLRSGVVQLNRVLKTLASLQPRGTK